MTPTDNPVVAVCEEACARDDSCAPAPALGQLEASDPISTVMVAPTPASSGFAEDGAGRTTIEVVSLPAHQGGELATASNSKSANTSKTWAFVAGALKKTLSGAVPFIPEPFKGPAEMLLKVTDVFEVSWALLRVRSLAEGA